jgi:hypothetical protein
LSVRLADFSVLIPPADLAEALPFGLLDAEQEDLVFLNQQNESYQEAHQQQLDHQPAVQREIAVANVERLISSIRVFAQDQLDEQV